MWKAWVEWLRRRRVVWDLSFCDDRLLADMGLCRAKLDWHVRTGRSCREHRVAPGGFNVPCPGSVAE